MLAWVVATVLAAGVAWWAVGTVGRGSGSTDSSVLSSAQVASALAAERARPTATPTTTPTPTPTSTSSPTPEPTSTVGPTSDPTTTTPPTEVARTWTVSGGVLSASCVGDQITLLYATPSDGWGVEIKSAGPTELEVEFDRHEEAETKVTARCVAGTPEAETSGDGSEDEHSEDD